MDNSRFPLSFPAAGGKAVEARFDGGDIASDAGLLFWGKPITGLA
jgi:hypothetical protein